MYTPKTFNPQDREHQYLSRYILQLPAPHTVQQLVDALGRFGITVSDEDAETQLKSILE